MIKSKLLTRIAYLSILFAVGFGICGSAESAGIRCFHGSCIFSWNAAEQNTTGHIAMTILDSTDLGGHPALITRVDEHLMSDVGGGFDIVYDTDFPAPAGTLKAVSPGLDLFPAVQTVHFNWLMHIFPDTFRTTETVTLISDELDGWPQVNMRYTPHPSNHTLWFKNINDPTDSFSIDLSSSEAFVSSIGPGVPSLTNWGMLILLALLVVTAVIVLYRKKTSVQAL